MFDDKFSRVLKNEFEEFFVQQLSVADDIAKKFDLRSSASTEDKYNSELQDNPNIAVSHTVLRDYVEIADAIFWDESTIYLMHNKHKFNGVGVRDVLLCAFAKPANRTGCNHSSCTVLIHLVGGFH